MSQWFAFLRGINLGKRQVKMATLKTCLEAAGFGPVRTVLASGNVSLTSTDTADAIAKQLEALIAAQFGFAVGVVLRSESELRAMLDAGPFADLDATADATRHVLLFDRDLLQEVSLGDRPGHTEVVRIDRREVYLVGYRQPNGRYTEGIEAVLKPLYAQLPKGTLDTMRNWNTIEKMLP